MEAIARASLAAGSPFKIVRVIADRDSAGGLARAAALGIPTSVVPVKQFADRASFDAALAAELDASGARLVALAGFMRILSAEFVQRFEGRLLNIHPSLLPKYKGLDTHARALAAGDSHHGASVHYVTAELDGGPVIMQGRLRIQPGGHVRTRFQPAFIRWNTSSTLMFVRSLPRGASNGAPERCFSTAPPSRRHSSRKAMRLPERLLVLLLLVAGAGRPWRIPST